MNEIVTPRTPTEDEDGEILMALRDLLEQIHDAGFKDGFGRPIEGIPAYRDAVAMLAVRGLLDT